MSLHPLPTDPIPPDTVRVARAAFPHGNRYLRMRDELGALYADAQFAPLFAARGQPAYAPWRLALVLLFQFVEDLSDRQAADAVRGRIDWKYALGLELSDPGFDYSLLSEFRARVLASSAEAQLLEVLLARFRAAGLLAARGKQRTDATHVLAAVRALNRLELVGETLRAVLNALAVVAPAWLRAQLDPAWAERYSRPFDTYRFPPTPAAQEALAATIGQDGGQLLTALGQPETPAWLGQVPAVATFAAIWDQQYQVDATGYHWRPSSALPPGAALINSPYDPEARYSIKRQTAWTGYKAHLTETCDREQPHLILQVTTTPATTPDSQVLTEIQAALAAADRLPGEHYVDSGYISAAALVESTQTHGVRLVGPAAPDPSWQARTGTGYGLAQFVVDWVAQTVRCPQGQTSAGWWPRRATEGEWIYVRFAAATCAACPARAGCTRGQGGRVLHLLPPAQYAALAAARAAPGQAAWRAEYAVRAGVEGTLAQGVRRSGLRQTRYRGLAKTHLQHILTAAALDYVRVGEWLAAAPLARTRQSAFAKLAAQAA